MPRIWCRFFLLFVRSLPPSLLCSLILPFPLSRCNFLHDAYACDHTQAESRLLKCPGSVTWTAAAALRLCEPTRAYPRICRHFLSSTTTDRLSKRPTGHRARYTLRNTNTCFCSLTYGQSLSPKFFAKKDMVGPQKDLPCGRRSRSRLTT